MPSLNAMRRINKHSSIGKQLKDMSDEVMLDTWDNDIQSRVCYIYDYYHDDEPNLAEGMTYCCTSKTRLNAKFIVTQHGSLFKDQVEYHVMFEPNHKIRFTPYDELYYYETSFKSKYWAEFPIGLYMDIPDEQEIYRKWLICGKEIGNQFIKYKVLPCDYYFHWIEECDGKRIKRQMWGCTRNQNSYNSGVWREYIYSTVENQNKAWLPMNSITEKLYYTHIDGSGKNQRIVMSAPVKHPVVWKITKIENTKPFGIQKITLAQDEWNPNTDYVNLETQEMYADYYLSSPKESNTPLSLEDNICLISCNSNLIKIGGSYKLLTVKFLDFNNIDITSFYINDITIDCWRFYIDDIDITNSDLIAIQPQSSHNQIKVKFVNNRNYLSKILTVKFTFENILSEFKLEISAL